MQFTFYRCDLANPSAPGQSDVRFKLKSRLQSAEGERRVTALSMEVFVRWMLPFGLAAIFVLAGVILDSNYRRSTPDPIYIQATVIDFERLHRKQVYGNGAVYNGRCRAHRLLAIRPATSQDRHILVQSSLADGRMPSRTLAHVWCADAASIQFMAVSAEPATGAKTMRIKPRRI